MDYQNILLEGDFLEEIVRMQENLLLIRRTVGWTAAEFGEKIGVTRQTINNIESGRNKLTKTQYIAMRSVLDAEIKSSSEDTKMLQNLLTVLIDNPEEYSEEYRKNLVEKANIMTPGILVGSVSRETVSKEWMNLVVGGMAAVAAPVIAYGVVSVGGWLMKMLSKKNENDKTNQVLSSTSAEEESAKETVSDKETDVNTENSALDSNNETQVNE